MDYINDPEKVKVLVTGANGFIGSNLCKLLVSKKIFVRAMALPGTPVNTIEGIVNEIVFADITKAETLRKPLEGITHVFHLAALASDWGSPALHRKVNTEGTGNMLEASSQNGVKRFLYVSSLAIHPMNGHNGSDETTPACSNINAYAISKRESEKIVNAFHKSKKTETVIIRPGFFPFGPADTTSFLHLAGAISTGKYAHINSGKSKISTSFIDNLTEGMVLAAFNPKGAGETFILCDNEPVSWKQIAEDIAKGLNSKAHLLNIPYKLAFFAAVILEAIWKLFGIKTAPPITKYRVAVPRKNLVFTNKKAKALLGYNPKISWNKGLRITINWYCNYISSKS